MSVRGERRMALHAELSALRGLACEFPRCRERWTQMAHLHSIGAGGRASADTIDNVMKACPDHALLSDGAIPGNRGRLWYETQLALIGITPPFKAWNIAEAIRTHVLESRQR